MDIFLVGLLVVVAIIGFIAGILYGNEQIVPCSFLEYLLCVVFGIVGGFLAIVISLFSLFMSGVFLNCFR